MNRLVLAGIASIVALAIIAFAIASASDDDDDDDAAAVPTATATTPAVASPQPSATTSPVPSRPIEQPTTPPDQPVSATPGGPQPTGTVVVLPSGRHTEPAPIDGLEVRTLESFPPQYMLHVKAGLPSGCAQPSSNRIVGRQGNVIQVEVLNSLPDNAICTAIYGTYELNINLGSDFTSGETYVVQVNGKEVSFKAQ